MTKKTSYQKGIWAEYIAALYLFCHGYHIAGWRHKSPFGEIDLLARRGDTLVCVEVKFRQSNQDAALSSVSPKNRERVIQAVKFFQSKHPAYNTLHIRFDIVTLSWPFSIRHHKNAWYDTRL